MTCAVMGCAVMTCAVTGYALVAQHTPKGSTSLLWSDFTATKMSYMLKRTRHHMSTAVRYVVKVVLVSKGKPQTSTPRTRETLGAIIVILTVSDYVTSLTTHPKFHYGTLRNLGWTDG